MKIEYDIEEVYTKKRLLELTKKLEVWDDWHESDEQGLSILMTGKDFDNAGCEGEIKVVIMKEGIPEFGINLATLLAFATGYEGRE